MSAAIVRKALEVSEDAVGPLEKALKGVGKKKFKALQKKKKQKITPDQLLKKNVKILKALEFASRSKKYGANPTSTSLESARASSKKSKKKPKETSAFTEEDFANFEKEYFVTDCICMTFLVGLAFVVFGAPFLPFLRPFAFPILVILAALGNVFVFSVIIVTICIPWGSKKKVVRNSVEQSDGDQCSKKTS